MNSAKAFYYQLIRLIHNFFVSIKSHSVVFVISLILGCTPFILVYNGKKNLYESSFTVTYEELVRKIYGDRLHKINILIHQNNTSKVATLLQVDKKVVASLVSVSGKNILGEDLSKDMNTDKIPFIVKIVVDDSSHLDDLQRGIIHFLAYGNDYMAEKNKIRVREINDEIAFIDRQLQVMDSIKRTTKGDKYSVPGVKSEESNISASLFQFSYELYKKKQDLERKKEMESSMQIVDDAIVPKSIKPSAIIYTIYSVVLSFFIYGILIGFVLPIVNYKE